MNSKPVDKSGLEFMLGDYAFCVSTSYRKATTFVGKVVNIGKRAVTVARYVKYRNESIGRFEKVVLQKPERNLLIPSDFAEAICPELVKCVVEQKEYHQYDVTGTEYKVGDFVFVAQHSGCSSVDTFFARVVKINECSVGVVKKGWSFRDELTMKTILMVPDRHLIVPAEVALKAVPELRE